ncbi:MAG: 23S rRNA (adenine(2503)-C(2))-methyltransferase RlmN [Coriobacteriales bacterium]
MDASAPIDIKALTHAQLEELVVARLGQPKFRVKQLEQWLWQKGVASFDEMTNLSKDLRAQLASVCTLRLPLVTARQQSADGTRKYLVSFADGVAVETVGIPSHDGTRLTVCFSTQAGCAMGCAFCATGWGGFTRNLTAGEMVEQVRLVGADFGTRVTNVVAMGQGEPFANYEASLQALRRLNAELGLGIGARHITLSSCGIIGGIERFAKEPEQFTLAISLHSAVQETRDQIMPGVKAHPLPRLRAALIDYGRITGRRPSLEYALMDGVNDTPEQLEALIEFCRGMLCHVNLIPLNPIKQAEDSQQAYLMEPSGRMPEFKSALERAGIQVSIRDSRGSDIDGACGQLIQTQRCYSTH